MKENGKPRFYGWVIMASCFIMIGTLYAVIGNLVNLFIKPLADGLGASRGQVGVYVMIAALVSVIGCAFAGKWITKYSLRLVTTVGALCGGIGYLAMAFATSLLQIYLISILLGLSIAMSTMIPVNMMLNNWFEKKRGLIIGIVFTAVGFGGFVFTQIISYFLTHYTYRQAYIACGLIMLILVLPVTLFLIRLTPEEMGQTAYGAGEGSPQQKKADAGGYMLKDIKKTPSFRIYLVTIFLLAIVGVGIVNQFVAHLSDNGYSIAQTSAINSVFMVCLIFSKPILGALLDKKGSVFTFTFSCICYMVAILMLGASQNGNMFIPAVAMVILSFAASITSTGPSFITSELYGKADFGAVYGMVLMVYNFGTAFSSPVVGWGYDLTGSYTMTGVVFLALVALMMVTIRVAKADAKKLTVGKK